jgi:hypothetical protein
MSVGFVAASMTASFRRMLRQSSLGIRRAAFVYRKMIQNLVWATAYNIVAIPVAAGLFVHSLHHHRRRQRAVASRYRIRRPEFTVAAYFGCGASFQGRRQHRQEP